MKNATRKFIFFFNKNVEEIMNLLLNTNKNEHLRILPNAMFFILLSPPISSTHLKSSHT